MSASTKKKLRKEEKTAQLTEKKLAQQKEAKKLKTTTAIFISVIALILVASLVIAGLNFYKGSGIKEKNTIAAQIGDYKINSVEMTYYYSDAIENFYQNLSTTYGDSLNLYLSMMGLDPTLPLSEQTISGGDTWADYFIDSALSTAHSNHLLAEKAKAEGFTITEASQLTLDNTLENLPAIAALYGYPNVDSYLRTMYGPGATLESYSDYAETSMLASDYYNAYAENLVIDDAAIRAYEEGKFDEYSSFSYANYTISYNSFLTGGTEAEDGTVTYTDEEKDAARAAAKAAAESLPNCTTVEELNAALAELPFTVEVAAEANTHDNALYTTLNTNVRQWMADGSRQVGDFTIITNEVTDTDENGAEITTVTGYTAYIFLGRYDNTKPMANIRHILVQPTDDDMAAAQKEAEALLQEYLSGEQTEDAFADLAMRKSDDAGSSPNGGLIEHITTERGIYVDSFTDWANDTSRQAGDVEIIESEYGYHIMYYVGDDELSYRDNMIREEILSTSVSDWYNEILASAEIVEKDTSLLNRDIVLSQ